MRGKIFETLVRPFLVAALLVGCGGCDSSSPGGPDGSPDARLSVSEDQGATWTRLAEQPPHRVVTSFLTDKPGRLLAVTTGGVYRLER